MSVRVVPMTRALAPALVDVHREAFAGYMNARLGRGYVRHFLEWFATATDAIALVALDDHATPVGYVVGAPLGYGRAMTRELFVPAALGVATHPALVFDRRIVKTALGRVAELFGRPMPSAPPPALPAPTWSLVGIGVASKARGLGAGSALTKAFEDEARARGARSLRLSVYAENAAARRTYERAGWVPFDGPVPPGFAMYYSKVLG
ncbi:GNAT family N-acetyltransferase [Myxococcota bacterium]|nr:GNAT family N-acetyltransferase [Myxococcota bacterium]